MIANAAVTNVTKSNEVLWDAGGTVSGKPERKCGCGRIWSYSCAKAEEKKATVSETAPVVNTLDNVNEGENHATGDYWLFDIPIIKLEGLATDRLLPVIETLKKQNN